MFRTALIIVRFSFPFLVLVLNQSVTRILFISESGCNYWFLFPYCFVKNGNRRARVVFSKMNERKGKYVLFDTGVTPVDVVYNRLRRGR